MVVPHAIRRPVLRNNLLTISPLNFGHRVESETDSQVAFVQSGTRLHRLLVLIHDILFTLDEVSLVWHSHFSSVNCLYLLVRGLP